MPVDTTIGGASANSWADETEFGVYATNRLPSVAAVLTATTAQITVALIVACRMMGNDFDWTGTAVDDVQALTWPRRGMLTRNGYTIATTAIPQALKDAQCEMAYELLAGLDLVSDNDALNKGIASLKAGSVAVAFQHVDTASMESVDMFIRRMGSEFNYVSSQVTGEVRRMLVPSWFNQPSIKRPIL